MKITINARVLKSALESANKGINPKPTIPSLANFLLEGDGSYLTITGSDGNTTIKETVPCETQGKALLPTNLLELVRTLPNSDVTIETEAAEVKIIWSSGQSTMPAFNTDEYPVVKDYEGEYLKLQGTMLAGALATTIPHILADEFRPVMGGVYFKSRGNGVIELVASDSHTLALSKIKVDSDAEYDFVIPQGATKILLNLAKAGDVEIANDGAMLYFKSGTTSIITRKVEGNFPNYRSIIPQNFASTLEADKATLIGAIKRVSVCANKASGQIKLSLGMLGTTIEAQDLSMQTSAKESIEGATFDGADLEIGFKGDYLLKCIDAIPDDTVKINFNDLRRPAIIKTEDESIVTLAMPILIQ